MRTIQILAKCNDMCGISFVDTEENIDIEKHGYVPRHLGIGGGDYIRLTIDVDSGQVLDWDFPDNEVILDEIENNR